MTGFRLLVAVVVLISGSVLLAERVEDLPKPTDYVSDYAHVLSPAAVARLDHICAQLDHSQANAQVAIVTVKTLDGDDHKRRIDVGFGLEGILPDGKVGDIGREMVPDLRGNDFDGAVTLAVSEVAQVIATDAKVSLDDEPMQDAGRPPVRHGIPIGKIILIIIVLVFFGGSGLFRLLFGLSLLSGGRGWGGGGGFGGGGGGGGGSGFGGFGGGSFGGGGAGGDW